MKIFAYTPINQKNCIDILSVVVGFISICANKKAPMRLGKSKKKKNHLIIFESFRLIRCARHTQNKTNIRASAFFSLRISARVATPNGIWLFTAEYGANDC